jgi:hypothetical protein
MIGRTGVERGPDDTAGNNDHERHGGEEDGTCTSDFFGGKNSHRPGHFFCGALFLRRRRPSLQQELSGWWLTTRGLRVGVSQLRIIRNYDNCAGDFVAIDTHTKLCNDRRMFGPMVRLAMALQTFQSIVAALLCGVEV